MRQKLLITMLLMLSIVAPFAALADSFYLNPADLEVDKTATLQFYLDNTIECYGFQAEITFPDGIVPVSAGDKYDVTLSNRASNGKFEVESNILSNGNFIMGAYSANQKPFTGNSGVLVDLKVSVAKSFKGGTVKISKILLIDKDDNDVELSPTSADFGVVLTGVSFNRESLPLQVGGTTTLVPTFAPTSATDKALTWKSSDESVATVTPTETGGLVTAVKEGEATITATASNGKTASCVVTVSSNVVEVTSIKLDVTELNLTEGDIKKLVATVNPENATDKTVGWSSDDDSVATVDKDGNVTAIGAGTAIITAEAGDKTATCTVTVKAKFIDVTGVTLNKTSLSLTEGETSTLKATVAPENATDKSVTWTSSDTSIATVKDGVVTAVAAGTATITATSLNGKTATCEVTVKAKVIAVTGVALDKTTLSLTEGETATLRATVAPANASEKSVTWTSSDDKIATVIDGVVTAVAPGTATITANASGKTALCTVTVKAKVIDVTSVTLNKTTLSLIEGETGTLTATVAPANATDNIVTWTSSNTAVATVDATGKVTAVAAGTATITATASGKTATCKVTVKAKTIAVTGVTLDKTTLSLTEGETGTLTATVAPENATDKSVTWTSSDESVATVSDAGEVTAVKAGTATITAASSNGKTATCAVTVKAKIIAVTGVTLDKTTLSLTEGETSTLKATITPENATDKTVTWTSSDESVATVSDAGEVTAVKAGTATITAASSNGKTVTCTVTVAAKIIPATGVTLSSAASELKVGESVNLTATVTPEDATDKIIVWTSSDEAIATVDATGKVTAKAIGEATVTATCGTAKATCKVTVVPTPVESIKLSNTTLALAEGDKATLTATIAPASATDKSVTWTSSDESVATVSEAGEVTAVKAGTATITATSSNGKTATCNVTVSANIISVTGITISKTELDLTEGDKATLTATITPENATDKTVTWTSSDESVATVSEAGEVTAVKAGTATITAASSNGKTVTCTVTVAAKIIPATGVTLSNTTSELKVGETVNLTATVTPEDATDKTIVWTSSDEAIATVDANGKVTAKAIGEATITATCGAAKATCKVTVVPTPVESIKLSNTALTLTEGDKATLTATVAPASATDKSVTWTSSDESVATVSEAGEVTAIKAGTATITATSSNGKTATCVVTVSAKYIPVEGLSILDEDDNVLNSTHSLALHTGDEYTLTEVVTPENATDRKVTWKSSDETIAKIVDIVEEPHQVHIDAIGAGEATITATLGDFSTSFKVIVTDPVIPVTGITLDKKTAEMLTGATLQLNATITPEDATSKEIKWTSSDNNTATVSTKGLVTAKKAGKVTITATANKFTATCEITITDPIVDVAGITLDKTTLSLTEGDSETLTATVAPENATDKTVTWTSSDEKIVSVDDKGVVTAVAPGTATITATASGKTATCVVTVSAKYIPVEGLSILDEDNNVLNSTHSLALHTGDEYTLTEVVTPENATDQKVTWTSSDETIAKIVDIVEEPHQVHIDAIGAGEATITATLGDFSTSFKVIVTDPVIPVTGITLDKKIAEMLTGATLQLNATITPEDATSKEIKWTSSDNNTATVSTKGLVTAKKAGKVTITATANKFTATCEITITDPIVGVAGITLDKTEATLKIGESVKLTATVAPHNATDKSVTWTSSNAAVATVDRDGNVTAVAAGEAIITAKAGDKNAECKVTVIEPGILLDITSADMFTGELLKISFSIVGVDIPAKSVKWSSSDDNIAVVNPKGMVTAKRSGKVTITAEAENYKATCEITVKDPAVISITLSKTEETIAVGETLKLFAILETEGKDATVTWTSSDESVATVDINGLVTAVGVGNVTIVATAGDKTAECQLTVEEGDGVALIGFDSDAPVKVYDLNGRHIADDIDGLQGGFYIVRQGNKAKKIRVK